MSVGRIYCCRGRILPRASEEVQKQVIKNVIQGFDLSTTVSLQNQGGVIAEAQDHGKAKDALNSAKKSGYSTISERYKDDDTYRARMNELGLNEDDIHRRDGEAKFDRAHFRECYWKTTVGKHLLLKDKLWT